MKRKFILSKLTAGAVASTMFVTTCVTSFISAYTTAKAATTSNTVTEREKKNANLSMEAATEGMVLLENKNNVLPIASKGNIALFGGGAYRTVKGGSGSGDVNQRYTVSVWDALKNAGYNITSSEWLEGFKKNFSDGLDAYNKKNANNPYKDYMPPYQLSDYALTDDDITAASGADTAIYVISRSAGEGADRKAAKGDYYLTDQERGNIEKMAKSFKNSIVLLNVGGVIDTKFIKEIPELDSVLLMSQAGMEGGNAAVKLLNGEITPSGKLTDTWAENYEDYPASKTFSSNDGNSLQEDYKEGIYVGYRYFDSFNIKPAYEFGYGLSYTTFDMNVVSVEADEKQVTVKVKVKNTGNYAGKEVAQVYFSAPNGKLDKPYQELAGYGKTDLLAPGESQILTISYDTSEMSSYSEDDAAYIMEKGDYIVRVGNSSRNTNVGAVLTLDSTVTTEKLSNQMKLDKDITPLSDKGITHYSYAGEAGEIANAPKIQLFSQSLDLIDGDNASKYDDQAVTSYISNDTKQNQTTGSAVETSVNESIDGTRDGVADKVSDVDTGNNENVAVEKDGITYNIPNKDVKHFLDLINGNDLHNNSDKNQLDISSIDEDKTVINGASNTENPSYTENKEKVDTKNGATLYDVYDKKISMEQFVAGLSVQQLADIVEGVGMGVPDGPLIGAQANSVKGGAGETVGKYYVTDGIPNIVLADGPAGIRITQSYTGDDGKTYYQYATAWPIGTLLAQTWNPEIMEEVSDGVGDEMTEFGVTLWLAPGMNIHRDPLCGRNFEYYSEDPFLTGTMGIAATKGVQSHPGIGVTIKHFATNNQENDRSGENNSIPERTLREIYLKGFEMTIKGSQPMAIMSSFNKINGEYAASNYDLLTDMARGEWNYNGIVMTDWNVKADPAKSMHAGNDLIMPGGSQESIIKAVSDYAPVFGDDGYAKTRTVYDSRGKASSQIQWNDFTPSAGGAVEVSTKVQVGTALNDKINDMVVAGEASVSFDTGDAETIEGTVSTTTSAAVTTGAGVEVTSDPMTDTSHDRIVTYYGSYADNNTIYLGDLQKSAMRVLNIIMQSTQFAKMNADKGVVAETYTEKYDNLNNYLTLNKENIVKDGGESGSTATGGSSSHHHSSSSLSSSNSSSNNSNDASTTSASNNADSNSSDTNVDVKNKWSKNADGTWSFVNSNGEKATGWVKDGDNWYHVDESGKMQTGWIKDTDGSWYFLNTNGAMSTGWLKDTDGKWYYLNNNGAMKTGWLKDINEKWYYLDDNGAMKTGWLKDSNGKWYYLNANGEMAVNIVIDGYKLDDTGEWVS